ncbi:PREDICTED: DJ-1 protein homolog E isoform X2 [Nelumbo nucifera]|uniref:DJ-1 protein homolog E isoform X2 n=1 Tax=Nelumbo nucifera TaxID=4432 RepID=A0A1U8BD47_NELNU|nr:PREDICTED: DJ-1 protein homolog E isoform X2 [Nelumbo nucifera]
MGSLARKSALMICGDYMEDYETIVPFHVLQAFGIRVDCVSPGKISGDKCITAVHDYMGYEDYVEDYEINVPFQALGGLGCRVDAVSPSKRKGKKCVTAIHDPEGAQVCSEKQGHNFMITADWNDICIDDYDCLVIPGGRSPEFLVMDDKAVALVKEFAEKDKIIAGIGQGKLLLAAAGLLEGKRCASGHAMKAIVKVAGGLVESTESVAHGKLLTSIGWPALPAFISELASLLKLLVAF